MKSVQNSLDSSKNSVTSAQEAGNKVIKNVAQGIQNTSWMFDKFSNLLDELASAFDDMPVEISADKRQVGKADQESSFNSISEEESPVLRDSYAIDASNSSAAIAAQMNFTAAQHAAKHSAKSEKNNQSDKEDANATEGSEHDEDANEESAVAGILHDSAVKPAASTVVQGRVDKSGENAGTDITSDEQLVDDQTQQFLAQQSQKGDDGSSEHRELLEKGLTLQDKLNEGDHTEQNPATSADAPIAEGDRQQESSSQDLVAVSSKSEAASLHEHDEGDLHALANKSKLDSTDSLQVSQTMAQSAAQQNQAANSSFQSAVKSAQSAVSQTVESVREMIKELGNVSNASAAVKALGQHSVSLATQIKAEKNDAQASKNPPPLTRSQLLRTLERVENTLKEIVKSKDGKSISLRLDPPSLGSLKIDISFKEGNLHARIVPESSQVALALRERAHELQSILRRVGIDAMQVSVTIASPSSSGQEVPHHTGNLFLGDNASSEGKGSFEGSDSTPKEPHKGLKSGKQEVLNQAGGSELDHWVA
jgi:flagellar hook-length control protein FliK